MPKPHPALIAAAASIWYLGGLGLILLYANVSDDLFPYRYLLIAAGTATMLLPAYWIRSPATFHGTPRESVVEHAARLVLFALGLVALIALGLLVPAKPLAVPIILIAVFEGYFVLGIHTTGALLARRRAPYYATRCPHCLYDLTSIEASTCPECGRAIIPPQTAATQSPAH